MSKGKQMVLSPLTRDECIQWIEALRSGKYKQGHTALRTFPTTPHETVRYCCLGVLADVLNLWKELSGRAFLCVVRRDIKLNREVQRRLSHFNDSVGWNFEQIANWIEEHILPNLEN